MQCKQCHYRLWNLPPRLKEDPTGRRLCPECGTAFLPEDFDFIPNRVAFCCPHCDQTYYGQNQRGHLEPREFECVNCHHMVHMNQMVLRPAEDVDETKTQRRPIPWVERKKRGFFRAWLGTVRMSLAAPHELIQSSIHPSATRDAWTFVTGHFFASYAIGVGLPVMVILCVRMSSGSLPLTTLLAGLAGGTVPILALLLDLFIWGGVTHGMLRLLGAPAGKLGVTYQCLCYSSSPMIVTLIPCIGIYMLWLGIIGWIVVAMIMLRERQQLSGWRTLIATLCFPCVIMTGIAWMVYWIVTGPFHF